MKRKLTPLEKAAIEFDREFHRRGNGAEYSAASNCLRSAALAFDRRYRREAEKET